jgi:HAD superfamily hydrolase (TIGR01509 family)
MSIKLIISDFDGPLASLKEAHFLSLNEALKSVDEEYVISLEEHISKYDGMSTLAKLKAIVKSKGFPEDRINEVFELKQKLTIDAIKNTLAYDHQLVDTFSRLKSDGYVLYVASNAIRDTVIVGLDKIGILNLFDKIFTNEDVKFQKPHPQIYLRCMYEAGVSPSETIIIEDSKNGKEAAALSGANVFDVDDVYDTKYDTIISKINKVSGKSIRYPIKNKLNVLIPCAGMGSRFASAGYKVPKPLIDVLGKPMIKWVVDSLNVDANFIFVVQKQHCDDFNFKSILKLIDPDCTIIEVDGITEGAACTTLLAKDIIDNDNHLLMFNSDQFLDWDGAADFLYRMVSLSADGGILTFNKENDTKWSYVKLNENGFVCDVKEKQPISNLATVGLYYYNKGSDYVKYAEQMINDNNKSNGEYYVAPVYNYAISDGKKIINYNISNDCFWGLGVPEDLEYFINNFKK